MSLENSFARKIYLARISAGYSASQVAHAAGISLRWYQYLERGGRLPSQHVMLRLMCLLGLDPSDFQKELCISGWRAFLPVEQHLYSPETGHYITYGIRVTSHGESVALISDISCDGAFVKGLAERCTQLQISPLQMYDIVLDSLV